MDFDAHILATSVAESLFEITRELSIHDATLPYGTAMNAVLSASLSAYRAAGMTPSGLMVAAGWGINSLIDEGLIDRPQLDAVTVACLLARAVDFDVDVNTLVYCIDHEGSIPGALIERLTNDISAASSLEETEL